MPNISSLLSPGERGMMGGCVLGVIWRGARRSQTETQRNPADIPRRLHATPVLVAAILCLSIHLYFLL